jgi:hypothetical protein
MSKFLELESIVDNNDFIIKIYEKSAKKAGFNDVVYYEDPLIEDINLEDGFISVSMWGKSFHLNEYKKEIVRVSFEIIDDIISGIKISDDFFVSYNDLQEIMKKVEKFLELLDKEGDKYDE